MTTYYIYDSKTGEREPDGFASKLNADNTAAMENHLRKTPGRFTVVPLTDDDLAADDAARKPWVPPPLPVALRTRSPYAKRTIAED